MYACGRGVAKILVVAAYRHWHKRAAEQEQVDKQKDIGKDGTLLC